MNTRLEQETERLVQSWMRHDQAMLGNYLIADVEDPRINVSSILTRHFLLEQLFGQRFQALKEQELRFAMVLNWLLALRRDAPGLEAFAAVRHALRTGADNAEGVAIPHWLAGAFGALPTRANGMWIPNYLGQWLKRAASDPTSGWADRLLGTFQGLWRRRLRGLRAERLSVLEPACGSANDYRFLDAFGLAPWLDYTGLDLCEKNVQNARRLFPQVRFATGNVFELAAPDRTFDVCFVHDLFEHLSLEGLEVAIAELCRVTRRAICAGFFNMDEIEDHVERPVDDYHWNTLSVARTRDAFARHAEAVQVIHIGSFLRWRFGCDQTHNPGAYTLIIKL